MKYHAAMFRVRSLDERVVEARAPSGLHHPLVCIAGYFFQRGKTRRARRRVTREREQDLFGTKTRLLFLWRR